MLSGEILLKNNKELISRQRYAVQLTREKKYVKALKVINENIQSARGDPHNYYMKGIVLSELLEHELSAVAFEKCIKRDKDNRLAKFYLGLNYLSLENFEEGCRYYDFRHDIDFSKKFRGIKSWSPKCKTGRVFIWAEQGIGDEVMFLQLLPFLENFEHNFILECDHRLHGVILENYPWLGVVARGSEVKRSEFDYQFPIGDLLKFFHKNINEIPRSVLSVSASKKVDHAVAMYNMSGLSLTGISWLSMNEDYGLRRSRSVEVICKHLDPAETAIVNLQYLAPESDIDRIRNMGFKVVDQFDCHQDIQSLFALISKCDKVISIDNSVAHFAGALGKNIETWIPAAPNWRWGSGKNYSYWYPSMKLKRFD